MHLIYLNHAPQKRLGEAARHPAFKLPCQWSRSIFLVATVFLTGCSSLKPWINQPLSLAEQTAETRKAELQQTAARDPSLLVAVTLSGGGARAAAFGFGVLTAMQQARYQWKGRDTNLLNATDVVSGVSGGSIMAAYFAAYGIEGLPRFEEAFLRQNFQNSLIRQALHPSNLIDLSSPWIGRSHLLARRLDDLFKGMTFGDVERRPRHPSSTSQRPTCRSAAALNSRVISLR